MLNEYCDHYIYIQSFSRHFYPKWLTNDDLVVVFVATSLSSSSLTDKQIRYFLPWFMWSCWTKGCPCHLMFIRRVSHGLEGISTCIAGNHSYFRQTDWVSQDRSRRFTACVCECVCVCVSLEFVGGTAGSFEHFCHFCWGHWFKCNEKAGMCNEENKRPFESFFFLQQYRFCFEQGFCVSSTNEDRKKVLNQSRKSWIHKVMALNVACTAKHEYLLSIFVVFQYKYLNIPKSRYIYWRCKMFSEKLNTIKRVSVTGMGKLFLLNLVDISDSTGRYLFLF